MAAKGRYSKSPKIAGKADKGEKVIDERQDEGHREAPPKRTPEDGPSVKSEKHPDKGTPTGTAETGMEHSSVPVHTIMARHAMERGRLHDAHMRQHHEMHHRHEMEHMAAMHEHAGEKGE